MSGTTYSYDLIIIGAGPAGLTAALYASRAALSTLVVDQSSAGGQVKTTHQVANFPGFVEPVPGYELARNMKKQAEKYGTRYKLASEITALDLTGEEKRLQVDGDTYIAKQVILATGSSPRLLNIPGEVEYKGSGVSYCATCDGEFYKDKDVIVIGGGNSAMEESLLLLQYVKSITVIHQFDALQAEKVTADRIMQNPKVKILWSHEPRKFEKAGDKMITAVQDLKTGKALELTTDGVFVFVGMSPNTGLFSGSPLERSEHGYVITNERMQTNLNGVYAAGDVRNKKFRQITTAVGDGTIAAMEVIQHR